MRCGSAPSLGAAAGRARAGAKPRPVATLCKILLVVVTRPPDGTRAWCTRRWETTHASASADDVESASFLDRCGRARVSRGVCARGAGEGGRREEEGGTHALRAQIRWGLRGQGHATCFKSTAALGWRMLPRVPWSDARVCCNPECGLQRHAGQKWLHDWGVDIPRSKTAPRLN